jgi:hypothetical protein
MGRGDAHVSACCMMHAVKTSFVDAHRVTFNELSSYHGSDSLAAGLDVPDASHMPLRKPFRHATRW